MQYVHAKEYRGNCKDDMLEKNDCLGSSGDDSGSHQCVQQGGFETPQDEGDWHADTAEDQPKPQPGILGMLAQSWDDAELEVVPELREGACRFLGVQVPPLVPSDPEHHGHEERDPDPLPYHRLKGSPSYTWVRFHGQIPVVPLSGVPESRESIGHGAEEQQNEEYMEAFHACPIV